MRWSIKCIYVRPGRDKDYYWLLTFRVQNLNTKVRESKTELGCRLVVEFLINAVTVYSNIVKLQQVQTYLEVKLILGHVAIMMHQTCIWSRVTHRAASLAPATGSHSAAITGTHLPTRLDHTQSCVSSMSKSIFISNDIRCTYIKHDSHDAFPDAFLAMFNGMNALWKSNFFIMG